MFTLLPAVQSECDEHHYHYTPRLRTQAVEALSMLRKGVFVPPPVPPRCVPAFAGLRELPRCPAVLALIHTVLTNASGGYDAETKTWLETRKNLVSERLVKLALHLLVSAFRDEENGAVGAAAAVPFATELTAFAHNGLPLVAVLQRLLSVSFWLTTTGTHRFAGHIEWLFVRLRHATDEPTRTALAAFGVCLYRVFPIFL
jgi:hypothetical protein